MRREGRVIQLIVHYPSTINGQKELEKRVADIHAQAAIDYIKRLNCPAKQKLNLVDSIMKATKNREAEK